MACAYHEGTAPTIVQLDNVSELERTADSLRIEMDAQLLKAFT